MFEGVLAAWLIGIFPAYMCWKSQQLGGMARSKTARYLSTIFLAGASLAALTSIWLMRGRGWDELGLSVHPPLGGLVGLAFAIVLVLILTIATRSKAHKDESLVAAARGFLPETKSEMLLFVVFSFVVGVAWEVLYRGFLLWFLEPLVSLWGAVLVATVAYALAHGISDRRRIAPSLLSALAFSAGYALTGSLWWLILIHIAFPLVGAFATKRPLHQVAVTAR